MNLAANVDELREAMSNNGVFPQNVLAADTNGDILFVHAGKTPVRPDAELDWMQPVDGNTSETAWQGIHPLEELLVIRSPAAGYLQNHNVDPHFMDDPAPEEVATRPGYVLNAGFIEVGRSHSRPLRSLELLTGNDAMTREQAFAKALDTKLAGTESWIELLSGAVVLAPPIEDTTFLDDLLAFDGFLDLGSTGALKYVYWREALREGLSPDQFQALADCLWDGASLERSSWPSPCSKRCRKPTRRWSRCTRRSTCPTAPSSASAATRVARGRNPAAPYFADPSAIWRS